MEYYINLNSVYRVDPNNNLVEEWTKEGWQGCLHLKVKDVRHQDGFLWVSHTRANREIESREKRLKEWADKERMDSGIHI